MQETLDQTTHIIKPRQTLLYMSIGFFVLIVGLSVFFSLMWFITKSQNTSLQTDIATLEWDIATIGKDRTILIANIVNNNSLRPSLDLIPLISAFGRAAEVANVRLKGFSIAHDTISTTLIATEGDIWIHNDPVATIVKMMRAYKTPTMDFSLEPIYSIDGDATMRTTAVEFQVLPSKK